MKVSTVAELLEMEDGDQPKAVHVKLSAVWKRREGQSEGKAYSFEDVEFMDSSGKIKGTLASRDPIDKSLIGQMLYIEAVKGSKGWSGLYIKDDIYKPKNSDEKITTKKLRVTATATITPEAEGDGGEDGGEEGEEEKPAKPRVTAPAKPASNSAPSPVGEVRMFLARAANLMLLSLRSAEYLARTYEEESKTITISEDHFQAITSTLFIAADRRGMIDKMPVKAIAPPKAEEAAPPPAPAKPEPAPVAAEVEEDDTPF